MLPKCNHLAALQPQLSFVSSQVELRKSKKNLLAIQTKTQMTSSTIADKMIDSGENYLRKSLRKRRPHLNSQTFALLRTTEWTSREKKSKPTSTVFQTKVSKSVSAPRTYLFILLLKRRACKSSETSAVTSPYTTQIPRSAARVSKLLRVSRSFVRAARPGSQILWSSIDSRSLSRI